jgi:DNA-dependent RNA polymerase auxiliary subunit epsilon
MTTVEMSYKAQTKQQLMQRFLDYEKQEQAFTVLLKLHQI